MPDDLGLSLRFHIYDVTMRTGAPPLAAELREKFGAEVDGALRELADARMLVLRDGEILMAGPFSAVPTAFQVRTPAFTCYGNCIWDALGIAATLGTDVEIRTSCGDCGAAARIDVRDGAVIGEGLMHFALPPRLWWQDVVFT
jgi:hypothetical protein